MKKLTCLCLLFFVLLTACSSSPEATQQTEESGAASTEAGTPIPPTSPIPTDPPLPTTRPLIWFNPLPHPDGSVDFMDLFTEDAPWEDVAGKVQVFELYGGWVAHFPWEPPEATNAELTQIVADLNRRGMAIAFGASPLVATEDCGRGIEGFFGPEEGLAIASKLKALGAEVRYVALDEPFAFGHIYSGDQACQWPAEKIARQVQEYRDAIHNIFPQAIIGDDEPLWAGVDPQEIIDWLDAYRAVTGENLGFLHLDLDFSRPDWAEAALEIETATKARGIEFGIFFFGDYADASDAEWLAKAYERARKYELEAGGKPDHIIFASWHPRPDAVLPESNPDTFSGMLRRYFLPRPALSASFTPGTGEADPMVAGRLTDGEENPMEGAELTLTLKPMGGSGLIAEYTLSGTVPAGATLANVGMRVNQECGCRGQSDLFLYDTVYLQGGESTNRVPNSHFSNLMKYWGYWGSARRGLETSDQGSGVMLHIQATPSQDFGMNSGSFAVTAGASYQVTFTARISPDSAGSGYFALFFLTPSGEISRQTIPLGPGSMLLDSAITGSDGTFSASMSNLAAGSYLLDINFPGSDSFFPAWAGLEISVP